jgi:hypothetical protein
VLYPVQYHTQNPAVRNVNEYARDVVAGGESIPDLLANTLFGQNTQQESASGQQNGSTADERPDTADEARAAQAQRALALPWWLLALLFVLVALVAFAVWVLILRARVRKACAAPDTPFAINARFRHLMRMIGAAGVRCGNVPYSAYTDEVEKAYGKTAARAYGHALGVWQQARYSTTPPTSEQRHAFEGAAKEVTDQIRSTCGRMRAASFALKSYLPQARSGKKHMNSKRR